MRKIQSLLFGAAALLCASAASAQEFGAKGTPAISVDRLFGFSIGGWNEERGAAEREFDYSHFSFGWPGRAAPTPYEVPRLAFDYFVIDSLSIGGSLGYSSLSVEDENTNGETDLTGFVLAPRVGYLWNFNRWASFWIRGGFTYHSFGGDGSQEEHAFALTVEPTFVLAPEDNWGFVLGPTLDLSFTGEREIRGADWDLSYSSIGIVRAGLIAWF